MKNTLKHRSWVSRIRLLAASAAVALPVVLVPTLVTGPSAQAQTYTVLYRFTGGEDGGEPLAGLIRDSAGNLYGTTSAGGGPTCLSSCGTIFRMDTTGTLVVLYTFTGGTDGTTPSARLFRDAIGNLYGTTNWGGDLTCNNGGGCGVIFRLDATGKYSVLHTFSGGADGAFPRAALIQNAAGDLYGTAQTGGDLTCNAPYGCGVVFKLDATGSYIVLHSFTSTGGDGAQPVDRLTLGAADNLYGTTAWGGDVTCNSGFGCGTIFKLDSAGRETVLYSFKGRADGFYPYALVRDLAGNFYGTTGNGGDPSCVYGCGTIFKLDTTGKKTVLHTFTSAGGVYPDGGLTLDPAGNLYGTTPGGGRGEWGTVFKLIHMPDGSWQKRVLHNFRGGSGGGVPRPDLLLDAVGNLYGTTRFFGSGAGVVFKITP